MAKIKMPKGTPSLDMTPMVDLAFLLVTFFMLNANFRSNEPVDVSIPSSIGDKEVPQKTLIMVTVDNRGRVFFNATGGDVRKNVLAKMVDKYKVNLSPKQFDEFLKISSIGCSMSELPQYLSVDNEGRKKFETNGIPSDTIGKRNELKDWLYFANEEMLNYGKVKFQEDSENPPSDKPVLAEDYKPKFVLKVEANVEYAYAKMVIETFRDLNFNNLHFVTSQEAKP